MEDKYLGFTYNNKKFGTEPWADFKGFIINDGSQLSFSNAPSFTNEFVSPQYWEKTIYLGNTKQNRVFDLNIQLDKITLYEYRKFLGWLNLDDKGTLVFDYNKSYGYKVKVNTITESEFYVVKVDNNNFDHYYINLNVQFITIEDFAAKWIESESSYIPGEYNDLIENEENLPFLEINGSSYTFHNRHNIKNHFIIEFNGSLEIVDGSNTIKAEDAGDNAKYFSEYGIVVKSNGDFVSCGLNPVFILDPWETKTLNITGTLLKIIFSSRELI